MTELMTVEIFWVERTNPDERGHLQHRSLLLQSGARIADALAALGRPDLLKALACGRLVAGVFGHVRPAATLLRDGDRVELTGPLLADAKQSRARRAAVQRARSGDSRWDRGRGVSEKLRRDGG